MLCPDHPTYMMVGTATRFGTRFSCPVDGCTVVAWSGSTSTPANKETRAARMAAHILFDPLWKQELKFKKRDRRTSAYRWLASMMDVAFDDAHIGYFSEEQCSRLIVLLRDEYARLGLAIPQGRVNSVR